MPSVIHQKKVTVTETTKVPLINLQQKRLRSLSSSQLNFDFCRGQIPLKTSEAKGRETTSFPKTSVLCISMYFNQTPLRFHLSFIQCNIICLSPNLTVLLP